jgi:hypothetical protein
MGAAHARNVTVGQEETVENVGMNASSSAIAAIH